MIDLQKLTISDASKLLAAGDITSTALVEQTLAHISRKDQSINAFITVCGDHARKQAARIDVLRKKGTTLSPLAGIPYSLKDVFCTTGIRTTAGSKILENYIPAYDSTVFHRLEDAGAVLIGKTNCDPFGFGASTEHSAYGPTKNPVDPTRVAGGSSGGAAAAVTYGGGVFAVAEDTGGSIRCPASFCGVVGLKPTYGRVSRYGAIAYASSFDCMGPITKTVKDNSQVLQMLAGQDPHDATSSDSEVPPFEKALSTPLKSKTIGIPQEYFTDDLDRGIRKILDGAIETFRSLGCSVRDISLPNTKYAIANYYVIAMSEASSNLARYDAIRYGFLKAGATWNESVEATRGAGFSDEEKRRVMLGTYALSAGYADKYYKKAQQLRELLKDDFAQAFTDVDVILTPTMPMTAFKLGEKLEDPLMLWLADAYTAAINPTGLPALSVPAGNTEDGLPVGMQLIAPHFREEVLYNFGYMFEHA